MNNIARQARLLDKADPDWFTRINTDTLDPGYCYCVLTQAFGGWKNLLIVNGVKVRGSDYAYLGLMPRWKQRWLKQIEKRREKLLKLPPDFTTPAKVPVIMVDSPKVRQVVMR